MIKYQGKCAVTEDLLEIFEKVSGKPISKLMLPWIEQKCFPELLIRRLSEQEYEIE